MSCKPSSIALNTTRTSWNIFASSILTMVTAGTVYFFPALGQGLSAHLQFSETEVTAVVTAVNAGALFSFVGGLMYKRAGSMRTTIFGALLNSSSYLGLGLLVRHQSANAFPIAVFYGICIGASGPIVYTASMATTAALFPKLQRGRIMGFLSAIYGMSAGVFGVFQSAFFPSIRNTEQLLYFVSMLTATPIFVAYFLFPDSASPAAALGAPSTPQIEAERAPLLSAQARSTAIGVATDTNLTDSSPPTRGSDDRLIAATYAIAFAVVVNLQFGAYASWTNASRIPLPGFLGSWVQGVGLDPVLRPQVLCALILVLLLGCFTLIPFGFRPSPLPHLSADLSSLEGEEEDTSEPMGIPFGTVMRDFRFQLMLSSFFVLPGCGTVTTLVQMTGVVVSRMFPDLHNQSISASIGTGDAIGSAVGALVVAFSACNMMSRLIAGCISDVGGSAKAREAWKLRLVEFDILLMCCATLGVAFSSSWKLITSVGLVGFAHGAFYAISPAQVSNWFGVDGFPLNFAVCSVGVFVSSVTICSSVATLISDYVMETNWVEVITNASNAAAQRYCTGLMCYAPTFAGVALLNFGLLLSYLMLHNRIVHPRLFSSYLPISS